MQLVMDCLDRNAAGHLTIGGCDLTAIAGEFHTPAYVMDENKIRENCRVYRHAMDEYYGGNGLALYASKALSCKAIYRIVLEEGMGVDVVSGGELYTALSAGFPAEKIYFHGNNKTEDEIAMAIDRGVGRIVVDNIFELETLNRMAGEKNRNMKILFRIKPGIDAHTHSFVQTGQIDSKFGVALETGEAEEILRRAQQMEHVTAVGVHCHIGSQIFEPDGFALAAEKLLRFLAAMQERGLPVDASSVMICDRDIQSATNAALRLLNRPDRPSAVFAFNDELAAGVLKAARRLGLRVPEDLAVVGFDDSAICPMLEPELSSVHIDCRRMGELCMEQMSALLNGSEEPPRLTVVPVALQARASSDVKQAKGAL